MSCPGISPFAGLAQAPRFDIQLTTELWQAEIVSPMAQYVASINTTLVTYFTVGISGYKNAYVVGYNHTTKTWAERVVLGNYLLPNDLHGMTAIVQDADGFFYCLFGSHGTAEQWSISVAPNDFSRWTQQVAIGNLQTYPHPVRVGSTLYLFMREDLVARFMTVRTMTPVAGNGTWSATTRLVNFGVVDFDSRAYISGCYAVGTDIHIVLTRSNAPDTEDRDLYYVRYDTLTGAVKNQTASVTVPAGSLPVSQAQMAADFRVYVTPVGLQTAVPSFCFDANGDPHISFFEGPAANGSQHDVKHITGPGGVWSAPFTVVSGITDLVPDFSFVSVQQVLPGANGSIEVWWSPDDGSKWRRIRSSAGVWGAPQEIMSRVVNPLTANLSVRNALPEFRVAFAEWTANIGQAALDVNAIQSRRYAFGDGGFITARVPDAVIDPFYPSVSLLLGFEQRDGQSGFINDALAAFLVAPSGNAQADTAQFKFGTASLLLDGTDDFVTVPNNAAFSVTNGDLTFECWIKRTASKLQAIATKRAPANSSEYDFLVNAGNNLQLAVRNAGGAVVVIIGSGTVTNNWHMVAFSRQGSVWRVFLDGVLQGQATESSPPDGSTNPLLIGRDGAVFPARDFDGWIDELRFTSGVCRYTANFTPPTAAFPRR
jgi:hypothetical protein